MGAHNVHDINYFIEHYLFYIQDQVSVYSFRDHCHVDSYTKDVKIWSCTEEAY